MATTFLVIITLGAIVSILDTQVCAAVGPYGGCLVEKGYVLYDNRCLKLYTIRRNYLAAKRRCELDGAHLFHLKSRELDGPALFSLLDTMGVELSLIPSDGFWLGADDSVTEGRFLWSDGTTLPSNSPLWLPRQPDNYEGKEDCVGTFNTNGIVLNDFKCEDAMQLVCQKDI